MLNDHISVDVELSSVADSDGQQHGEADERTYPTLTRDNSQIDCVICLDSPATIIIQPCKHKVVCRHCAEDRQCDIKRCPICRANVERMDYFDMLNSTHRVLNGGVTNTDQANSDDSDAEEASSDEFDAEEASSDEFDAEEASWRSRNDGWHGNGLHLSNRGIAICVTLILFILVVPARICALASNAIIEFHAENNFTSEMADAAYSTWSLVWAPSVLIFVAFVVFMVLLVIRRGRFEVFCMYSGFVLLAVCEGDLQALFVCATSILPIYWLKYEVAVTQTATSKKKVASYALCILVHLAGNVGAGVLANRTYLNMGLYKDPYGVSYFIAMVVAQFHGELVLFALPLIYPGIF